jgi:hypothetical protein
MVIFAYLWEEFFLNPAVVWILVPITAIVLASAQKIYEQYCRHAERIEMIQSGIHPDLDKQDENVETATTEYFTVPS